MNSNLDPLIKLEDDRGEKIEDDRQNTNSNLDPLIKLEDDREEEEEDGRRRVEDDRWDKYNDDKCHRMSF